MQGEPAGQGPDKMIKGERAARTGRQASIHCPEPASTGSEAIQAKLYLGRDLALTGSSALASLRRPFGEATGKHISEAPSQARPGDGEQRPELNTEVVLPIGYIDHAVNDYSHHGQEYT